MASRAADAARFDTGSGDARSMVLGDALAALPVWTDPQRPPPVPGQFVDANTPCPATEPKPGTRCEHDAQQCDYPVCHGRGYRSWVCVEQSFTLWFDESFLCAPSRPCPSSTPSQGTACSLSIECVYEFWCCKGPSGYQSAHCDGRWTVGDPACVGCTPP